MLVRTSHGVLRDVWVETDPAAFAGVQDVLVRTRIARRSDAYLSQPTIDYTEVYMYIDASIGNPVVPDPIVSWDADDFLQVRIQQTDPDPGSGVAFTLDIRLNSTSVR